MRARKVIVSLLVLPAAVLAGAAPARAETTQSPTDAAATALVRGDSAAAIVSFTEALKDTSLTNDRKAAILNDRGVAYMRSGQPKLAIDDFNLSAQLLPEYAAVYNNRGNVLLSLGLVKEAIKDFDRALVLAPGYASAYNNRAGAYMRLGQTHMAILDYTKAVQLMPNSPAPLNGRGRAYFQLAKPYAAVRDFTRAVNSDARFAAGYRNRAEAKVEVEQYDEAIEDLSRAIAFDPNNAEIYVVRGNAYMASRNAASAVKDFARAVELDPKLVAAYQLRGLAHGMLEAYDEGFTDLNLAIELDPRSAVAFAYRAVLYKRTNQIDIGQKDLQTALRLDENRAEVWWAKGEIEEGLVQTDLAIASYKKALELKPGYRDATEALQRLGALPLAVGTRGGPTEEPEAPELAIDKWRVVMRSGRPVAMSQEFPRVSVPLEALGDGPPKLLSWELKKAPFLGIGVLRFHGGVMPGRTGKEEIEFAAVIDVDEGRVVAIEQQRQGARVANWTWEEGKLTVASADGVTDEFNLRVGREAIAAAPTAGAGPGTGRRSAEPKNLSFWSPFDGQWNQGGSNKPAQRYTAKKKPKSLLDLLFN